MSSYARYIVAILCLLWIGFAHAQTPLYVFCQEITTNVVGGDEIVTFEVGVQRSSTAATSSFAIPDLHFASFSMPVYFDKDALEFLSIDYNEDIWEEHYSALNPFYEPSPLTIGTPAVNYTGYFYASGADMKPSSTFNMTPTDPLLSLFQAHFKKIGSYTGLPPVRIYNTPDVNDGFYDSHLGSCYDIIVKPLAGVCDDDLLITGSPDISTNVYEAVNTITSSNGIVATGSDVTYHAGQSVSLEAGFCVEPNALFHAYIEPCMNMFAESAIKVFLQGAYRLGSQGQENAMTVELSELLPKTSPYRGERFAFSRTEAAIEQFPNGTVDWVFVEIRDKTYPSIILTARSALLKDDGTVMNRDGSPTLVFEELPAGEYHIAVRHRNHLGVMTAKPIRLEP